MKIKLFLISLLFTAGAARGQETQYLPDQRGSWQYSDLNDSKEWFGARYYKLSPDEARAYRATVARFAEYFGSQPLARQPAGVNLAVKARAHYAHYDHERFPVSPAERVKAQLFIQFCPLFKKGGRTEAFCDEVPYADVRANDPKSAYEPGMNVDPLKDAAARERLLEMFYEPAVLLDLGGGVRLYDWYYDNRVVAARPGRSFKTPVTTKEFISRVRAYYTAAVKEGAVDRMALDAVNAEIAATPADLLDKPVYTSGELEDRPLLGICGKDAPGARAMYVFNPDYFDPALPRTAVQLLTIMIPGKLDSEDETGTAERRALQYARALKGGDLLKLLDVK